MERRPLNGLGILLRCTKNAQYVPGSPARSDLSFRFVLPPIAKCFSFFDFVFCSFLSSIYLPSCDPKGSGNCVILEIPLETYSDSVVECNYKKEKGRRENGLVDNLWKDLMGSMIMEKDLGV